MSKDLPVRRVGRPKAIEPRSTVSTWLPASKHDELIAAAKTKQMSVSAYVRGVVFRTLNGGL